MICIDKSLAIALQKRYRDQILHHIWHKIWQNYNLPIDLHLQWTIRDGILGDQVMASFGKGNGSSLVMFLENSVPLAKRDWSFGVMRTC